MRADLRCDHSERWTARDVARSAWFERSCKPSLRSHLISDVDRPQKRLIVIHKDECASRVAIMRGLFVQS
jgi:hypothetical protein